MSSTEGRVCEGVTVETKVHFRTGRHRARRLVVGVADDPAAVPAGRVPRVSRLVALALKIDQLVREGRLRDYADAARLAGVTRARVTQIANLALLAPDIIEKLLHLPRTVQGRDPVTERHLRRVVAAVSWDRQRLLWSRVESSAQSKSSCISSGVRS